MASESDSRTTANSSNRLKKRLAAYSLAAGAVLVGGANVEAAVIHFSAGWNVNTGSTPVAVDMDGDGTNDYLFFHYHIGTGSLVALFDWATNKHRLRTYYRGPGAFSSGFLIGSAPTSVWRGMSTLANQFLNVGAPKYGHYGNFDGQTKFIGVKFLIGADTHYGWIRYTGNTDGTGRILDWAYEDLADTPIVAGDTGEASTIMGTLTANGGGCFVDAVGDR